MCVCVNMSPLVFGGRSSLLVRGESMTYHRPIYLEQCNGEMMADRRFVLPIPNPSSISTQQSSSHIMTCVPDLSSPETVLEMATCHDQEASDALFAIYALCDVDQVDITRIITTCD